MADEGDELAPELHASRRRLLSDFKLNFTTPAAKPKAIILAGQPGAGKTKVCDDAKSSFDAKEGFVVVDTDQLRAYHPKYKKEFAQENDRTAAGRVQKDAGQWSDELIEDAVAARRNLIVDGTLKTPDNARGMCKHLKENGYEVEVRALAVPREDSEMRVYRRYERQRQGAGTGRWVPQEVQRGAYDGMLESLRVVEKEGLVDNVKVYADSPSTEPIYANGRASLGGDDGARKAAARERGRERTREELKQRHMGWQGVIERIKERDPKFETPENARAKALHDASEKALTPVERARLARDVRPNKPEKAPRKK